VVGWANGVAAPLQVAVIKDNASFKQWYADSAFSIKSVSTLELPLLAGTTNQYQFSSGTTIYDDIYGIRVNGTGTLSSGFFPLEASAGVKMCNLWPYWATGLTTANCVANATNPVHQQWDPRFIANSTNGGPVTPVTGVARNFYFTSEIRYLFRYAGGETLTFFGDDDVWVYINGHLALDLGAPHERLQGTVTIQPGGNTATSALSVWNNQTNVAIPIPGYTAIASSGFGLTVGSTYEIAIFHADQHPRESNYQLTVSGYATTTSACVPTCGDGKVATGEECDDGGGNSDTAYGGCTTSCKFGPFCGDMVVNGPEQCDLGPKGNTATYGTGGCTAGCMNAHFCGDAIVDSAFGEQCDTGANNMDGSICNSTCHLTPK
jgi:fibro-slime domain-containing protein